jgi:hypothetical protein
MMSGLCCITLESCSMKQKRSLKPAEELILGLVAAVKKNNYHIK